VVGAPRAASEPLRKPGAVPLLVTKLHPPPRRDATLARSQLIERLRPEAGVKLTVVAAPAGAGKSTLLAAWREVEIDTCPVAWLTLDRGDNDPVVLWSYLLAALRGVVPDLGGRSSPEVVGAAGIQDSVLPQLINGLAAAGEVALVLDDFHQLSSGPARDSIAWFIDRAPPTFRLVLATRSEPALPLATLRARGALRELRAADLAFTAAEAEEFLNERLSLGLLPESIRGLVERTEGWPAGLYLAALSLRGIDDRDGFVTRFGAENRHVIGFLVEEVLDAHDPVTQQLMLRASILDRLCGPLCDAVLEQDGSGKLLEELSRANMFLVPLDDRGEWYRFHHLFG
jgi:LuxR family transcriptional regulator, maltose regulon positive regulatory protein